MNLAAFDWTSYWFMFPVSIGVALFIETFGISSGFVGYFRKRLIDFKSAIPFIAVGVPIGIVGAILLKSFKEFEEVLRGGYAVLMPVLAAELIRHHDGAATHADRTEPE